MSIAFRFASGGVFRVILHQTHIGKGACIYLDFISATAQTFMDWIPVRACKSHNLSNLVGYVRRYIQSVR